MMHNAVLCIIFEFEVKNMRYSRRSKILEIIENQEIDTQNRLVDKLRAEGYDVTQATVSRDIKELNLVKVPGKNGRSRYAQAKPENEHQTRFKNILKQTVLSITPAENLIVIKTVSGCGNAAAESIDSAESKLIVGTIAGDNTVLVVIDKKEDVPEVMKRLNEAVGK